MMNRYNDVLFFNLHRRYLDYSPNYGGFLGIYALSAFLNSNGYYAQGFAGQLIEGKSIIDNACQNKQVKIIGLYVDYENVSENIFLSSYITEKYNLPVIVGGPQATALKEDFYKESKCVAVVIGEGELTVQEIVEEILDGEGDITNIAGLRYWYHGKIIETTLRPIINNIDALPMVTPDCYVKPEYGRRELSIMTGRGCPFHCAFCYEGHHTSKVRFRSVKNVLMEVKAYLEEHPKRAVVLFTDDTFTLIPERVKELCEGLQGLQKIHKFSWFAEGHIHTMAMQPEMIEYMGKAGCFRVQLGIEAGSQLVLDKYRKGCTLEEIRQVIIQCREAGISQIFGNLILGGALYSREIYEEYKNFATEIIDISEGRLELGVVCYWPLAETSITNNPAEYGINIVDYDFLTSLGDFPQTETDNIDKWELANMMRELECHVTDSMKNLIRNRRIPRELIMERIKNIHGVYTGMWGTLLMSDEMRDVYAYYNSLCSGECCSLDDVPDNERMNYHPVRLMPFHSTYSEGKILYISVSKLEREIFSYTTGKLSIKQIQLLFSDNITEEKILSLMKYWEDNYLVIFSKF